MNDKEPLLMNYIVRKLWDLPEREITGEALFFDRNSRREFLKAVGVQAGLGLSLATLAGCRRASLEEIDAAGDVEAGKQNYPFPRNEEFEYGRPETVRHDAAEFTNFYEFTGSKAVYQHVDDFQPDPWSFRVDGLCRNPRTYDLDDVYATFSLEERAYRLRCVETWAMCVPWTGFPLSDLIRLADPLPTAKYVRFETFLRPKQAPQQSIDSFPWPYNEGLTLKEAVNPLTLLVTGIYGRPLPKQHGAPIRMVAPWKYGFKSIKSITRIELTDRRPATFWNTMNPHEYDFEANVNPEVPHPRWSQETEWMLGTRERHRTVKYNGYGDYVARLYET
jgi:methionine sulfoxide reductase catalytic subunit